MLKRENLCSRNHATYRKALDAEVLAHLVDNSISVMKMLCTEEGEKRVENPFLSFERQGRKTEHLVRKNAKNDYDGVNGQLEVLNFENCVRHLGDDEMALEVQKLSGNWHRSNQLTLMFEKIVPVIMKNIRGS